MEIRIKLGDPVWEFELDWEDCQSPVFSMRKIGEIKYLANSTALVSSATCTKGINLSKFLDQEQCLENTHVKGYHFKHYATSPEAGKDVCLLALASMRKTCEGDLEKAQKRYEARLQLVKGLEDQEE